MARDAKLAVFDMGLTDNTLRVPPNLETIFFPPAYKAGARISSNSWGSSTKSYTQTEVQIDKFVYGNPDFLVVVAAGSVLECATSETAFFNVKRVLKF